MALPPLLNGAVQLSTTCPSPALVVNACGADGTVTGVAVVVALVPLPSLLTARTLNVYSVPLVKPVNVCPMLLVAVTHVVPLSLDT